MVFVIRSLILFSAWTILGISSTVRADGVSEIEIPVTEQRQGDTDDSKSAASFDKRLPPVVPGESHPDGRQEMNIWSTSGPVPVPRPEMFFIRDEQILARLPLPGRSESAALSEIKRGIRD
jgi:hypothetical protein